MSPPLVELATRPLLITGGTGFVGRHLVAALQAAGAADLRLLVRGSDGWSGPATVVGDLAAPATLAPACAGREIVLHLAAAMPGQPQEPRDLAGYRRVNVEGTLALARAAAAAGARRFVLVSSTAAMGRPPAGPVDETTPCRPASPYEVTKHEAEEGLLAFAAASGLAVTILRPCVVAGAGQRGGMLLKLFAWCRRGLFPAFGGRLDRRKPLVAVEDLVQAIARAALCERRDGLYLITSGEPHLLRDMVDIAGRLVGQPRPSLHVPLPLARLAAAVTTPLASALGRAPPLSPERLDLFLADRMLDIGRARRELGYAPTHGDLEAMLATTHAWYVASGQLAPPAAPVRTA